MLKKIFAFITPFTLIILLFFWLLIKASVSKIQVNEADVLLNISVGFAIAIMFILDIFFRLLLKKRTEWIWLIDALICLAFLMAIH